MPQISGQDKYTLYDHLNVKCKTARGETVSGCCHVGLTLTTIDLVRILGLTPCFSPGCDGLADVGELDIQPMWRRRRPQRPGWGRHLRDQECLALAELAGYGVTGSQQAFTKLTASSQQLPSSFPAANQQPPRTTIQQHKTTPEQRHKNRTKPTTTPKKNASSFSLPFFLFWVPRGQNSSER